MELTKELFLNIIDCLDDHWLDIKETLDYNDHTYWGDDYSQVKVIIAGPNKDSYRASKIYDIPNMEVEIYLNKGKIFIYNNGELFTTDDFNGTRDLLDKLTVALDDFDEQ